MSKALEAWPRADLVAEVKRLQAALAHSQQEVAKLKAAAPAPAAAPKRPSRATVDDAVDYGDRHVCFKDVIALRETASALFVKLQQGEIWFPKSTIHGDSEVKHVDDEGDFIVTRYIAEQKDLI